MRIKLNENINSGTLYAIAYCEDPDIYSEEFWGWDTESDVGYELMEFGSLIQDADIFDSLEAAEDRADDVLSSIFEDEVFIVGLDPYTPHNLTGFVKKIIRKSINESKYINEDIYDDIRNMTEKVKMYTPKVIELANIYREANQKSSIRGNWSDSFILSVDCNYIPKKETNTYGSISSDTYLYIEYVSGAGQFETYALYLSDKGEIFIKWDPAYTLQIGFSNYYIKCALSHFLREADKAIEKLLKIMAPETKSIKEEIQDDKPLSSYASEFAMFGKQESTLAFIEEAGKKLGYEFMFGATIGKEPYTVILDYLKNDNMVYVYPNGSLKINNVEIGDSDADYDEFELDDYKDEIIKTIQSIEKPIKESKSIKESDEEVPYTKAEVESDLKSITHNFTDKEGELKCGFEEEKNYGVEILKKYYKVVKTSSNHRNGNLWYRISFAEPIKNATDFVNTSDNIKFEKINKTSISSIARDYIEVAYICDGFTNFRVFGGGFKTSDALVAVEDEKGKRLRLTMGDVCEFYTWYDAKGNVIHEPTYYSED